MAEIINFSELAQRRSGPAPRRGAGEAPAAVAPVDQRRSFAFLVDRYLLHHQREHSSPKTLRIYRSALASLVQFFDSHGWRTDLDDHPRAILEHARAWAEDFQARPSARGQAYSAASVHQYVRSARAFFNWLFEEDYTDFHYLARLERPRLGEKVPRALSDEQVNQLLQQPEFQPNTYRGVRNLCTALLFLDTWARLSEIASLPLANVHVADGWILVHGKGGRERALRFGRATQDYLLRYLDRRRPAPQRGQDHFFLTQEGRNLSVNAVHCVFARIRLRTGIPVSAHRLRHTGATAGARQKMALDDIRKKLGHTTTKATFGYIHLAEQLPSADDQPSGLDYLNITLPRAKRRPATQPSGSPR